MFHLAHQLHWWLPYEAADGTRGKQLIFFLPFTWFTNLKTLVSHQKIWLLPHSSFCFSSSSSFSAAAPASSAVSGEGWSRTLALDVPKESRDLPCGHFKVPSRLNIRVGALAGVSVCACVCACTSSSSMPVKSQLKLRLIWRRFQCSRKRTAMQDTTALTTIHILRWTNILD